MKRTYAIKIKSSKLLKTEEQIKEVEDRIQKGLINFNDGPKTKTIKQIIKDNVLTYFNYLNLALGIAVFVAGAIKGNIFYGLKNCLFMGVIIVNSIISIIEEIISKKIIEPTNFLWTEKQHLYLFQLMKL